MGLRERIEQELRAAFRDAAAHGEERVNVASRVNKVVVRNVGGRQAEASAQQVAPVVQEPAAPSDVASPEDRG